MKVETRVVRVADIAVQVLVVAVSGVLYVWAGTQPTFGPMAMAMPSRLHAIPLGMVLRRGVDDTLAQAFATRLSKKHDVQVFVSMELPRDIADLREGIEKHISDELASVVALPEVKAALFPGEGAQQQLQPQQEQQPQEQQQASA